MRTRLRAPIPAPSWLNIVRLASVVLLLGLVSACQTSDQGTSDDAAANANQSAQDSQGGQNSDGGENGEADSSDDTALPGGPIH
ncbi:MAG: hypothetical protein ACK2T6_06855, partial [Anaerolineae bacterium]